MMKTKYIRNIILSGLITIGAISCTKDLDQEPYYEATSASVYKDFKNYKSVLAKLYGGLALTGSKAPAGNDDEKDVKGVDEGFSQYLRGYWSLQEFPTDEAVWTWYDRGLSEIHEMSWTPNNEWVFTFFARAFYQITLCNEFIRETSDKKLSSRGITGTNAETAKIFRAEARFLRALSYWHAMDLFGSVPFVTENNKVGAFFPTQISKADLFKYIETELLELELILMDARKNEYARADKAAAWMLLTKLYLNAEVYIGQSKYTEAITYANKVITSGYSLTNKPYSHLFLADNHLSREIIFPVAFDGTKTQSYGGTTFLVCGPLPSSPGPGYGVKGGWTGTRSTKEFVSLFDTVAPEIDARAMFYKTGHTLEVTSINNYAYGYPLAKFKNVTSTGADGSDPSDLFVDVDFPMFRLADAYLMYAEAILRGGSGGSKTLATNYINELRERAYGSPNANITENQLDLDFILAERGRELSCEGHRRTDLIRFGKFTTDKYLWEWKGNLRNGRAVEDYRKLYPIPTRDIVSNPTLKQNEGY